MLVTLSVAGLQVTLDCAPEGERRLRDLAAALDARVEACPNSVSGEARLAYVALALLDEAQTARAALMRALTQVERMSDLMSGGEGEEQSRPTPKGAA